MVLNSRQLHQFLAIVEHGSLGRAAKALHISEPAISKSVKILEDALQVSLFDRGPRGLLLTPFGESLAGHSRVIVTELRRAIMDVSELRGTQAGHVHVAAGPSFTASMLPRAVARLLAARPKLRVSVTEGYAEKIVPMVLHGEIDFALMTLDPRSPDPDLVQENLAMSDVIIIARREHPLAGRATVSVADLQDQTWMLTKGPDLLRTRIDELFTQAELKPPTAVIEYASVGFARGMLKEADVISFLPRSLVAEDLANGELVELPVPNGAWQRPVGFLYRRWTSQSPACRALLNELRDLYGARA
jgi:DNA-binding transcriptional LysR family regulator